MSLTVLLVEDDRELRATLRETLIVEGYRVHAAASLADAHALLNQARSSSDAIDLVLLDLAPERGPARRRRRDRADVSLAHGAL